MSAPQALNIRPAGRSDVALILRFIRELAEYEELLHEVVADEEKLETTLFGPSPSARVLIAEWEGEAVGFALFHDMYSTFIATPGLYLEDLYVQPSARGRGIGKALLLRLARLSRDEGYCRLDWSVLRWNAPAIGFYERLGARELEDWTRFRLDGAALAGLADDV